VGLLIPCSQQRAHRQVHASHAAGGWAIL
jgi:hypothetical protein